MTKPPQLTKEEKLKLIQALEEKERRKNTRQEFVPHSGQLAVLKSQKLTKIVTSGNGWGKSTFAVNLIHARALGIDKWNKRSTKVPLRIVVVLDHPDKIEEVYSTEYRKWHPLEDLVTQHKHGKPYVTEWVYKNGSSVKFMTWQQDLVTFESIQFDLAVYDEPPPRPIFIALSRGQRDKRVQPETVIVGTPVTSDAAWLREDFVQPWTEGKRNDIECFTGGTVENEHNLQKGYIERFSALLTEKEKRVRLQGEFSSIEGLAFGHLVNDTTHQISKEVVNWDYSWPVVVGLDPHPTKSHVAVMVGRRPYDDKLFVLKEISEKATARNFASTLLGWATGYRVVEWICDSLGSAETTGHEGFRSFIEVLNECGIRVRATTFDEKLHEDAVNRIREMLALEDSGPPIHEMSPRLKFIEGQVPRAYKELKNISWVYDKKRELNKPKLDSARLDYFSALTYALSSKNLAKVGVNHGTLTRNGAKKHAVLGGVNMARGLGITTSKGGKMSAKTPMKRWYTRARRHINGDDDE